MVSFLKLTASKRLDAAKEIGWDICLEAVLSILEAYYCHGEEIRRQKFKQLKPIMAKFNWTVFKEDYEVSGDNEKDCMFLIALFG